jgi:hypothetical protein
LGLNFPSRKEPENNFAFESESLAITILHRGTVWDGRINNLFFGEYLHSNKTRVRETGTLVIAHRDFFVVDVTLRTCMPDEKWHKKDREVERKCKECRR